MSNECESQPVVGRSGMSRADVCRLVRDLKRFRAAFSWPINDKDKAGRTVDDVLRVARRVLRLGGTYYTPRFWLDGEEVSRGA